MAREVTDAVAKVYDSIAMHRGCRASMYSRSITLISDVPTEEEFDYGGYEVFWSMLIYYVYIERVYPFRREEASRLIRFAADNKA